VWGAVGLPRCHARRGSPSRRSDADERSWPARSVPSRVGYAAPVRGERRSRTIAAELRGQGHEISASSVAPLLRRLGYSLQANQKVREGARHPDRDAQFHHINETVGTAITAGEPVISVDTKKKELIGDFKNAGREWRPKGAPEKLRTHDFKDKVLGTRSLRSAAGGSTWAARATQRPRP